MVFDRTNWRLFKQETQEGLVTGVDEIIVGGNLVKNYTTTDREIAWKFQVLGRKIAFVVSMDSTASYIPPDDELGRFLDKIGTSGCISLLQKAIRRRPRSMKHPETGELYSTVEIVRRIASRACCGYQQGFFLPVIGKFVSGFQHFLKRLFIIAAEDSSYDPDIMFELSSAALLASLQPVWSPSNSERERFVAITTNLLMRSVTSYYDTSEECALVSDFKRAAPALIQSEMGGMQGDQRMLRWLASHPEDCNRIGEPYKPLSEHVDGLEVYCDQHQDGRLVCLLPVGGSYSETLSHAFHTVSGFNTRRHALGDITLEQQTVHDALLASSRILRGIVPIAGQRLGPEITYELDRGAIAGMVGTIEITYQRSKYFVTVSARNIGQFIVIPKPSRDNKRGLQDITPEMRDAILVLAKGILTKGRRVGNPIEEGFRGKRIHFQESGWYINGHRWDDQRVRTHQLRLEPDFQKLDSPTTEHVSWSSTFGQGHVFSAGCRQFALGRMAGYDPLITIPKMNREGKGTDEALVGTEAEAYQFFMHLSKYFPDAIWPSKSKPFAFETECIAFRNEICAKLRASMAHECDWLTWTSQKTLRPSQLQALSEMHAADQHGLATFLWMLVGQGKTLTVLQFLQETRSAKYIVWSLPKSAVESVARQITEVGWKPVQLYPSQGLFKKHSSASLEATRDTRLLGNVVYMIEHDHLYKLTGQLSGQMNQTAFVFDEVHKAMQSGTKRTAAALQLARISKQLVALTGTPIVDKSGYGLIQWLRLCVPFPVRASNFWVAANSMISPLNTGEVVTQDIVVQAPETMEEKAYFKSLFPSRAPWHGQLSTPSHRQWLEMRTKTDEIVTKYVIRLARQMISRHPTNWRAEHFMACSVERKSPEGHFEQHSQRPLIVASCQAHAVEIVHGLLQSGVLASDILLCGGARPSHLHNSAIHKKSIHLTEQAVLDEEELPFKCVVAAIRNCEGYSLTWMTCMITGSYPSNQASRTQMRGRINRLDAQRLFKRYITVLAGTTTITHRYHLAAKMMEDALKKTSTGQTRKKQKSSL
jgi:superfamily II DNA or RNA helicase